MKNKKKIVLIVILILAAILIALSIIFGIKLFSKKSTESTIVFSEDFNSGYGDFLADAYINDGETSTFSYVSDGGPDGSGCLRLESASENDARFVVPIEFKKNTIYRLSCDILVEQLNGYNPCAGISVYSVYASGFHFIETITDDWQTFTIYFKTDSTETLDFCLRLGYFSRDTSGICNFDNVSIETVVSVPDGAFLATVSKGGSSSSTASDAKYNQNTYYDMRLASILIIFLFAIIFGIWGMYLFKVKDKEVFERDFNLKYTLIGIFVIALIFRLILSLTYFQCDIDVNLFKYWGDVASEQGISNIYSYCEEVGSTCDYPPLFIYFLSIFSAISNGNDAIFTVLVKILPILSDLFIGFFISQLAIKKKFSHHLVLFLTAMWLFNPMVLLDSSCWGQVDSFLTVFVLLSAYYLYRKKYFFACLFVGLGIMLKPQMIIFLPVLGSKLIFDFVIDIKNKSYNYIWKGFLGGMAGLVIPAIPFFKMGLEECKILGIKMKLPWIVSLFAGTVDSYDYASVNCYNFWFLMDKNWVKDSEKAFGLSLYSWGMLAIVIACIICLAGFVYLIFKKDNESANNSVFAMGAMIFMTVSCFGPRMHERYFFPALALMIVAYLLTRLKLFMYDFSLMSVFGFISVHEIMLGILVGGSIKNTGSDQSLYSDFYWPELSVYRGIIALFVVVCALLSIANAILVVMGEKKK